MENISRNHKYFIQFMLKNGICTLHKAIQYCSKLNNEPINQADLLVMVNQINRVISSQQFKISRSRCEVTQDDLLIWLNMKNDTLSKLQLNFTERELEYFQALMQEIIHSEQRKLMCVTCLNITSTITQKFSRESGQRVLDKWIRGGYFVKNEEFLCLGPRLILEFASYLRLLRPECICPLCLELSFSGKICATCDNIFHSYCIEKYLQDHASCPSCRQEWKESQSFNNMMREINTQSSYSKDVDMNSQEDIQLDEPGPSTRRSLRND